MRRIASSLLYALFALLLLAAVPLHAQFGNDYSKKDSKKLLPKALKGTWFGMPRAEFVDRSGPSHLVSKEDGFRFIYEEAHQSENKGNEGLKTATYYFDGDGNEVLYEVILDFESHLTRDAMAFELFGAPNAGEDEWWFPSAYAFPLRIWLHENKLVIAAVLPGTPWEGEWE